MHIFDIIAQNFCRTAVFQTFENLRRGGGRGYSQKNWVGLCSPLPKTLTLFMTKICDIPYSIYDLTKIQHPIYDLAFTSNPVSDQHYNKFPSEDQC